MQLHLPLRLPELKKVRARRNCEEEACVKAITESGAVSLPIVMLSNSSEPTALAHSRLFTFPEFSHGLRLTEKSRTGMNRADFNPN